MLATPPKISLALQIFFCDNTVYVVGGHLCSLRNNQRSYAEVTA
jgi:hypothetical protein